MITEEGDILKQVLNNILWNDSPNVISSSGAATILCRNCDVEKGTGIPWFGIGCIDQYPNFVNPPAGAFHLSWNNFPVNDSTRSPCIDSGDPASYFDSYNIRADIGALYFNQSTGVEEKQRNDNLNNNSEIQIICQHHKLEIHLPNQI